MFQVRVISLCGSGTADILCAQSELQDLKPKLLCGSGTAERQVAVGGGGGGSCVEAELRNFQALHVFLVRKRNFRP